MSTTRLPILGSGRTRVHAWDNASEAILSEVSPPELQNRPCGGRYGDILQAIGNTSQATLSDYRGSDTCIFTPHTINVARF